MQNWKVLQKKISEMNKDEFIKFVTNNNITMVTTAKLIDLGDDYCIKASCSGITCCDCKKNILNKEYQPPK